MNYDELLQLDKKAILERFIELAGELKKVKNEIEKVYENVNKLQQEHLSLAVIRSQLKQLKETNDENEKKELEEAIKRGFQFYKIKDENELEKRLSELVEKIGEQHKKLDELEKKKEEIAENIEIIKFVALLK